MCPHAAGLHVQIISFMLCQAARVLEQLIMLSELTCQGLPKLNKVALAENKQYLASAHGGFGHLVRMPYGPNYYSYFVDIL